MANVIPMASKFLKPSNPSHMGLRQQNKVMALNGTVSSKPLTYLDSTATALTHKPIHDEIELFLKNAYANTHTTGHHRGSDSTKAVGAARESVGELVGYDASQDVVIFNGNGATGPLNYLAQVLFPKTLRVFNNPRIPDTTKQTMLNALPQEKQKIVREMMEKPIVITTEMEHHANQLPWFNEHVKVVPVDAATGALDLNVLKELLAEHKGKIRLVSVSGASNITGIMSPIYDIARMAHAAGAEICVDCAQLAPHHAIEKRRANPQENLDYITMSPHKFGVPNTPGVLVANQSLLKGRRNLVSLGGGMVNTVSTSPPSFTPVDNLADGEEPGTPNIPGIIAIGLAADGLAKNMHSLSAHELALTSSLLEKLQKIGDHDINIIGSKDPTKRVGVVSFTVEDVPHPIVTSFLNDHWNIAVRNGCFCAHPLLVRMSSVPNSAMEKIKQGDRSDMPGYIRASFGEHNTHKDVETLVSALTELVQNKQQVLDAYSINAHGNAVRKDGFKQPESWSFKEATKRLEQQNKVHHGGASYASL